MCVPFLQQFTAPIVAQCRFANVDTVDLPIVAQCACVGQFFCFSFFLYIRIAEISCRIETQPSSSLSVVSVPVPGPLR